MRIYIDTSVIGGYFDDEFRESTREFVDLLFGGKAVPLLSVTLFAEIAAAPEHIQLLLEKLSAGPCEVLEVTEDVIKLRDAYLQAEVVSTKWSDDALHVAHASVAAADVIVSWNFKHLVNPMRIREFDAVNAAHGFGNLVIITPSDIVRALEEQDNEVSQ